MKLLIAEDELVSLKVLENILTAYSEPDVALDGEAAFDLFSSAYDSGEKYDLICLDINS